LLKLPATVKRITFTEITEKAIRHAIEHGEADFDAVARAIHETGALEHARQSALSEVDLASQALEAFPASKCKDSLLALCAFALDRDR
jgi:octaprenyl-diphosphate synthase